MDIQIKDITILQVIAKPYDFNGKQGISYKADVVFSGGVATFKTNEEVYNQIKDQKNVDVKNGIFKLEAFKLEPSLRLESIVL